MELELNNRRAFDVAEFCAAYGISRGTFHNWNKSGIGPRTMKVGGRVLIPVDALKHWEATHSA